jgi:predicted enzyme related to lactoylglutathione lyase
MSGQGSFIWIELATSDVPAAIDFYKHVVGWNAQKFDGPMPYFVLDANGQGSAASWA